jgi:hypothetical protein
MHEGEVSGGGRREAVREMHEGEAKIVENKIKIV